MRLLLQNEQDTLALGKALAKELVPGDVVLLMGDLGAGKSVLARGIGWGMGVEGPIPSPSFAVLIPHQGTYMPFYHLDLYRLSSADEMVEMGLDEYLHGEGVTVVEWPQRAQELMPARHLTVSLAHTDQMESRIAQLQALGGFVLPNLYEWESQRV